MILRKISGWIIARPSFGMACAVIAAVSLVLNFICALHYVRLSLDRTCPCVDLAIQLAVLYGCMTLACGVSWAGLWIGARIGMDRGREERG